MSGTSASHDGLLAAIDALRSTWRTFGTDDLTDAALPVESRSAVREDLDALRERLMTPKLSVGVVGPTSSGKSTLVNALVGEDVWGGSEPRCGAPLLVEYGTSATTEILSADGRSEHLAVDQAVDESASPPVLVRRTLPSPVLESGLRLFEEPGWDPRSSAPSSLVHRQRDMDMTLALVRWPPGSADVDCIRSWLAQLADELGDRLIVVCNLDSQHVGASDQTRQEIQTALSGLSLSPHQIIAVSATFAGAGLRLRLQRRLEDLTSRDRSEIHHQLRLLAGETRELVASQVAMITEPVRYYDQRTELEWRSNRLIREAEESAKDLPLDPLIGDVRLRLGNALERTRTELKALGEASDLPGLFEEHVGLSARVASASCRIARTQLTALARDLRVENRPRVANALRGLDPTDPGHTVFLALASRAAIDGLEDPAQDETPTWLPRVGAVTAGAVGAISLPVVIASMGGLGLLAGAAAGWVAGQGQQSRRSLSALRRAAADQAQWITEVIRDAYLQLIEEAGRAITDAVTERALSQTADIRATIRGAAVARARPELHHKRQDFCARFEAVLAYLETGVPADVPKPLPQPEAQIEEQAAPTEDQEDARPKLRLVWSAA